MKKYCWNNHNTLRRKTGGGKARLDVSYFLKKRDYASLTYYNSNNLILKILLLIANIIIFPLVVEKGGVLFVQYPYNYGQRFLLRIYKKIKKIKCIFLIHDLESLRMSHNKMIEVDDLKYADAIISLTSQMTNYIEKDLGVVGKPIVDMGLWDYSLEESGGVFENNLEQTIEVNNKKLNVLIAGNLDGEKAKYISQLHKIKNVNFILMGDNFDVENIDLSNITYLGAFNANTVLKGFEDVYGLVWDGDSLETCSGSYGSYLSFNLPHKTSFYLVNNIPVIIWNKAAVFDELSRNNVVYGIEDLYQLEDFNDRYVNINDLSCQSHKILNGFYLNRALDKLGVD